MSIELKSVVPNRMEVVESGRVGYSSGDDMSGVIGGNCDGESNQKIDNEKKVEAVDDDLDKGNGCDCKCNDACGDTHSCGCNHREQMETETLTPQNVDFLNRLSADGLILEIYRNRSVMEANIIIKETGEVIERIPVQWKSRENKLDYLSVSKIHAYEDCPACFYHQYMSDEGIEEDSGNFFTEFGSILHNVVEKATTYYKETGLIIDPMKIFDEVWKSYKLTDSPAYTEGKELIADYFARNPVDQRTDETLFAEEEWRGELGGITFGLQLDYAGIMKNDPTVGILRDYKSNRMPFTPSELDDSLQLRIYELVLRRHLAPQIKQWITGYEMFRFGFQQCPPRTMDDLLDAECYVNNIATQIRNDNTWEEKLNNYCGYRKCRFTCKKYCDYVKNPGRYIDIIASDNANLADVNKQRENLATYEKIAKGRKDECANIIKSAIEDAMKNNKKFVIDGQQLELYSNATSSYRYQDTKNVLLVNNKLDLLDGCLTIGKTKMDAAVKSNPQLKLALAGCMTTNYASPYIVKHKSK